MKRNSKVSTAVIRRLPRYYRQLSELQRKGVVRISSSALGKSMGLTASQIRQDLFCFGGFGQQGYGYKVDGLKEQIGEILGINRGHTIVVLGAGNLGRALIENFKFSSNGFQLLAPHIETEKAAAHWLHWVCCALDRLATSSEPEELALCSYAVSTDPHALDGQKPAGHLLLHALAYWKDRPVPAHSRDRLALYRECGLMLDDISCFTVQRGLILALPDGREHPACAQLRQQEQFCLLTSSQISALGAAFSPTGRVYLLENQMVFSTLCRQPGILHPMICTSGQLREASWQLLDLLAASGCSLYYAGDFDPEGLAIADRLWQTYGDRFHLWHMTLQDYQIALSAKPVSASSRLSQLEKVQCPFLQPVAQAILHRKRAGYQEALVERYRSDLVQPG